MVESFLSDPVKDAVTAFIALVIVLSVLARVMPHIGWLQFFSLPGFRKDD